MNWLERFFSELNGGQGKVNLPSLDVRRINLPANKTKSNQTVRSAQGAHIPNAALIYGVGAAMVFACALYFLFTGAWLTSFLLLLPAGALFGFAHLYLKHFG